MLANKIIMNNLEQSQEIYYAGRLHYEKEEWELARQQFENRGLQAFVWVG